MAGPIEINGIRLRDPEDTDTLRDNILNGVQEEIAASFPRSYGGVRLEVKDVHYDGNDKWNYEDQGRALMEDKFLSRKLRGTLRLIDERTEEVLDEGTHSLMRVPWMTPRGTFVHGGNEYTCFHPSVQVWTEDGYRSIGDIVKSRWGGRVWSYNFSRDVFELRKVVGWSEKKKTRPLGTLEHQPLTGFQPSLNHGRLGFKSVWATENHQIMQAGGTEVAANMASHVLAVEEVMTPSQRQLLIGTLLGDGHISPEGIYRVSHCKAQADYVTFKHELLGDLVTRPPREGGSVEYPNSAFHTVVTSELKVWRAKVYPAGTRCLDEHWFREGDERALAFWFMDDGSSQYQRDTNSPCVTLHTNNFTPVEVSVLRSWLLEKWDLTSFTDHSRSKRDDCSADKNRLIVMTGESAWRFLELVSPYIVECLRYKLLPCPHTKSCQGCSAEVDPVRDYCDACLMTEVRVTTGKLSKTIRHRFGSSARARELASVGVASADVTIKSRWADMMATAGCLVDVVAEDNQLQPRLRQMPSQWCEAGDRSYGKRSLVYDITVEGNHNYVAQGILVHNTVLQNRLMAGAYTRRAENGLLETHFNPRPGSGRMFRAAMDPETAQFRLGVKGSNLHLYSLLKDLGVPEDQLEHQWGPEVYRRNRDKYDRRVLPRAYKQLVPTWKQEKDADHAKMSTAVKEALEATQVSRSVATRTLPNWFDQTKAAAWRAVAVGRTAGAIMMAKRASELPFSPDFSARELKSLRLDDNIKDRSEYQLALHTTGVVKFADFSVYPETDEDEELLNNLQAQAEEEWLAGGQEEDFYDVLQRRLADSAFSNALEMDAPLDMEVLQQDELLKYSSAPTEKERAKARRVTMAPKSYAQAEAGNYRKGILYWDGLQIRLETPKGKLRKGMNENDEVEWSFRQMADYGYVKGSMGKDGDQVDVFIGPDLTSEVVYIIDQIVQTEKLATECKSASTVLNEVRTSRLPGSSGVSDLAGDEGTLHEPAPQALSTLRGAGNSGLRQVAEELPCISEGHGDETKSGSHVGSEGCERELLPGKLSLGDPPGATAEQAEQPEVFVQGKAAGAQRDFRNDGDSFQHLAAASSVLGVDSGGGYHHSTGDRPASKEATHFPREDTGNAGVGGGVGNGLLRNPQSHRAGLDGRGGADHGAVWEKLGRAGDFDEHKVILGCNSREEAKQLYLSNYEAGWKCGKITSMTLPQFKVWVGGGRKRKPVADLSAIKAAKDHAAYCASQDPEHFDSAVEELELLEKQAFSKPENPDIKDDHAKYQLCAGMNDWEEANTWVWCDITHSNDDQRRLWFKVKFPDHATAQDDYDPKKISKADHDKQVAHGKEHGDKAWKTWKRVASDLLKTGNDRYVSENEGRHRTVTASTWEQAFRDALKHEDMQPFVEDSGELRSAWRESKSASDKPDEMFNPDLGAEDMQEAYDAVYGKTKPRLASMQAWPEKWLPPGSDQLGWINWYRNYLEGTRSDDDERQIKRWKSFKARHGSQFAANPTPRRAYALRYWAIDPLKLLPAERRSSFQDEMEQYRAERTSQWFREKTADFALPDLQSLGAFLNTNHQAGIPIAGTDEQIEQAVIRFLGGDDSEASALLAVSELAAEVDPSKPTEAIKAAAPSKGCLMLQVPDHDTLQIVKWVQENIAERDLAGDGIERSSHVTVLYGFEPDVTWNEVKPFLPEGTIDFKLGRIKRFEANPQRPDSDVLVVEVISEDLQALHKKLCEEFKGRVSKSYPDYHPHLTLAYVKPLLCKSLDGHGNFDGKQFACSRLKFSGPQKKRFITLKTK